MLIALNGIYWIEQNWDEEQFFIINKVIIIKF